MRSSNWHIRLRRRSVSPCSASPANNLAKPGLRSTKVMTNKIMSWQRWLASLCSCKIWLIRLNRVCSAYSISPSSILPLLGKCRYKAASETPTCLARAAVVMRPPGFDCNMMARAWRISSRRLDLGIGKNLGAHTAVGKNFKQQGMGYASVDDLHAAYTARDGA